MAMHNPHTQANSSARYTSSPTTSAVASWLPRWCRNLHVEPHFERQQCGQPRDGVTSFNGFGTNPESWLAMQYQYGLWRAKSRMALARVGKVRLTAQ